MENLYQKIKNFVEEHKEDFDEEKLKAVYDFGENIEDKHSYEIDDLMNSLGIFKCYHCGEIHYIGEAYHTDDDYVLCEYCFETEAHYCDYCGYTYYEGEMLETDRNDYICEDCAESYEVCEDCGAVIVSGEYYRAVDTDNVYCESCYDNHLSYCDECQEWYEDEEMHYDEHSGNTYCDECWQERGGNIVESYGYKINPLFLKSERENELGRKVLEYLGVEVEMEKGEFDVLEEVKNDLDKLAPNYNEMICWKHDGSLDDGAEMNSVACSMNKWTELKDDFGKAFQKLIDAGWRSHDTNHCGYHIHISRNSLGKTKEEQDATIDRMILLTEVFKEEIKKFSRRKDYYYCKFASESGSSYAVAEMNTLDKCKHFKDNDDGRYLVINNRNHNTVEFRVFRGTLNINTFMACLQLVHNIANICKKRTLEKFDDIKWLDIINYTKDFKEIKEYNNRRGIKSIKKVDLFQKQQELGLEGEM